MERPGGADRPEPPPRPSGRDHPGAHRPLSDEPVLEPYARHAHRIDLTCMDGSGGREPADAALRRFRPEHAGLAPVSQAEADQHISRYADSRPWLALARYVSPDTRRLFVALDLGQGHALERHEGAVTPRQTAERVTLLCDPAIPGEGRVPGVDAYKPSNRRHLCADTATRITDPDAFATCIARALEHPRLRAAFDDPPAPGAGSRVDLSLNELLGDDGYRYCDGHRLIAVDGNMQKAMSDRGKWVDAIREPQVPSVLEPKAVRLAPEDFQNATVRLYLRPTRDRSGLEISTMYVQPGR